MTDEKARAQEAAFEAYARAKARVDATMDFRDAIEAGQAWVRFLNVFLEPERRLPAGNIIKFPDRKRGKDYERNTVA
jgi:hypothetical protein